MEHGRCVRLEEEEEEEAKTLDLNLTHWDINKHNAATWWV